MEARRKIATPKVLAPRQPSFFTSRAIEMRATSLLGFASFERLVGRREWAIARGRGTFTSPLSPVDVSSVANRQNHNLISLNVEHDTIVADTKSI